MQGGGLGGSSPLCLLKITECLHYLTGQLVDRGQITFLEAMPTQEDTDEESNLIQLVKIRGTEDQPVLSKWVER